MATGTDIIGTPRHCSLNLVNLSKCVAAAELSFAQGTSTGAATGTRYATTANPARTAAQTARFLRKYAPLCNATLGPLPAPNPSPSPPTPPAPRGGGRGGVAAIAVALSATVLFWAFVYVKRTTEWKAEQTQRGSGGESHDTPLLASAGGDGEY